MNGMGLILYLFYAVLVLALFRLSTRLLLSLSYNLKRGVGYSSLHPKISVVVPAFNEEVIIKDCIRSLLQLNYADYEVIVVDDGSTDNTLQEAREFEASGVKVIHQENQGKANALNNGIRHSHGEIVVTVDADTRLHEESLSRISRRFVHRPGLGAVAGNVKVARSSGLLNALQASEYTTGINLIRKAQSILGCVMIVPGPIAALKRKAVEEVGLLSDDTFAEDFDVTMKILKGGYRVEYEEGAIAFTDAPKDLEDLMKQRRRWYRGRIQVLDKHRSMYLRARYGWLGILGVPNLWFDTVSPILNVGLILVSLLTGLLTGSHIVLTGLAVYFGFELAAAAFAVSLDPMPQIREFLALPVLPFYNLFLDGVRTMALTEETTGVLMRWEKPRRSKSQCP